MGEYDEEEVSLKHLESVGAFHVLMERPTADPSRGAVND
jgi:hypothetical protein